MVSKTKYTTPSIKTERYMTGSTAVYTVCASDNLYKDSRKHVKFH